MRLVFLLAALGVLSGCSHSLQLMERNGGKLYQGEIKSTGIGSGTLSVGMEGRTCMGTFSRSVDGSSFRLAQTHSAQGSRYSSEQISNPGGAQYKALMSCSDGTGMRCDVSGGDSSGAGICVDGNNKVYDLLYSR